MAECLISPVKEIGKCIVMQCVWPFLKPHVDYWWCFDSNIQGLRDGIEELERQKHYIEQTSEEARLRCPGVEEWLKKSTEELAEARRMLPDDNIPIPKGWDLVSRYSMGKKAKKTAEEIEKLRNNGHFNLENPAPSTAMRFPFPEGTMDFESRKSIEKDIIDHLKGRSVGVIGICGMGGVGKTTMAQRIGKRVLEENLFDEVLMVTVSKQKNIFEIQEEIAQWLGLKLFGKSESIRGKQLSIRLMDPKRKIIILDDVWESLRFEVLGIPVESNSERCKVLLTSRARETCNGIQNIKVLNLEILEKGEAWNLFREKAGQCAERSELFIVAQKVAEECKGLPIALVTVGVVLQDEMEYGIWAYSFEKLKESDPIDFQVAYQSLKLSYDKLDNVDEQMFFLLCCLFPEDCNIPVRELTWYSIGLQIFGDISIELATNKTQTLVGKLKKRYLLIEGRDKLHVKIHDVVRDVGIYIGSKENNGFLKSFSPIKESSDNNCNWMSVDISNVRMKGLLVPLFPKLQLLMLLKSSSKEISGISFEGMKDLNVLSFQSTWIGSLPPTLRSLKNLQTLCLVNCKVENISDIGELTSLKIFSCYECENITELPKEIGELSGLRLLELNECPKLQRIPFGIISGLVELEELKIRRSFSEWKTGGEMGNAAVTELGFLPKLTCLEIEISDWNLAAQEIHLSEELVKYWIRIGSDHNPFEQTDCRKVMILNLAGAVGNWIPLRARDAESLSLRGDGSENINLAETTSLRNLEFSECLRVKKLVEIKDCNSGIVFPRLETLRLSKLKNLEEICERTIIPNQNDSLRYLKSIEITSCPKLRSLFSVSVARCLLQLEVLEIESCEAMEQVFWNEIRDDIDGCIEFPKLKKLRLRDLPNLKYSVFPLNSETLCNLKSIKIVSCSIVKPLFSVSVARRCVIQLEVLEIADCDKLEQVFWNEGTDDNTDGCIEFPKLKELRLWNLPNLTAFCQGVENITIKFPNLTQMKFAYLPKRLSSEFRNT